MSEYEQKMINALRSIKMSLICISMVLGGILGVLLGR